MKSAHKSAFGVEHSISKAKAKKDDKSEHYGRMATDMGTVGAAAGTVGVGAGIIGEMERRGHDPMGFTERQFRKTPLTPIGRARVLKPNLEGHKFQAKVAVPIGAASLALAGGYKHKQRKAQAQFSKSDKWKSKASDVGMGAASAGVGGGALVYGMKNSHILNSNAKGHQGLVRAEQKMLKEHKSGEYLPLTPAKIKAAKRQRAISARVIAVKKPGALISGIGAAAGGATLLELARRNKN